MACSNEADAASGADVVLNVNSSHDAEVALTHALPGLRPGMVWAELNTSSAKAKQQLAALVAWAYPGDDTVLFADVAIMNPCREPESAPRCSRPGRAPRGSWT